MSAELAHEIRNPLSSIKAAADLLSEGNINPKLINMIKEESTRLNRLLSDFLLLSRPREAEKIKINVKDMLNRIVNLYDKKGIVKLNVVGSPYIFIDEKGFESAVSNVLKNAVRWAENSVVINVYGTSEKLFIEVEDDGPGIKDEDKEKIFDPFFTKSEGGTGLGLAIAKKVVMENGGSIFVEDSELGGSKFVLIFPVGRENESNSSR
nr:HAMP domain-containing sensor histidine kinase [Persephonella atlantica]